MLGVGEAQSKKPKYEQQKKYNERRKEKPRKAQFSLNFQFNFSEEEEMRATKERFVRLQSMANLPPGPRNADFLQNLLDRYQETVSITREEMHSVAVQANATDTIFELYAHREIEVEMRDFECQWLSDDGAPAGRQILSPARVNEDFFIVGQDSLALLLKETCGGCPCGSLYLLEGDTNCRDGHVLRLALCCKNGHKIKWASSSILGNKYTANCRFDKSSFMCF